MDRRTVVKGAAALLVACGAPAPVDTSGDTPATTGTDTTAAATGSTTGTTTPYDGVCGYTHDDTWLPLALADYPELATVGGYTYADLAGDQLILARVAEDCVAVLSRICTHQGCEIHFSFGRFSCPCHGSTWAMDGTLQGGPAANQRSFPAELDGDTLWLDVS